MALSANNAYAGRADLADGVAVFVAYLDAKAVRSTFGPQKTLMPNRKRPGWYWYREYADVNKSASETSGPFSSSRKALLDAIKVTGVGT
jgi:hypothetical protein